MNAGNACHRNRMCWGEPDWSGPGYGAITAFVNTDVNVQTSTDGKVKIKFAL